MTTTLTTMDFSDPASVAAGLTSAFDAWLVPLAASLAELDNAPELTEEEKAQSAEIVAKDAELESLTRVAETLKETKTPLLAKHAKATKSLKRDKTNLAAAVAARQQKQMVVDSLDTADGDDDDDMDIVQSDDEGIGDLGLSSEGEGESHKDKLRAASLALAEAESKVAELKQIVGAARVATKKATREAKAILSQVKECKAKRRELGNEVVALRAAFGAKGETCKQNQEKRTRVVSKIVRGTRMHAMQTEAAQLLDGDDSIEAYISMTRVDLMVKAVRKQCALDTKQAKADVVNDKKADIIASHASATGKEDTKKRKRKVAAQGGGEGATPAKKARLGASAMGGIGDLAKLRAMHA